MPYFRNAFLSKLNETARERDCIPELPYNKTVEKKMSWPPAEYVAKVFKLSASGMFNILLEIIGLYSTINR